MAFSVRILSPVPALAGLMLTGLLGCGGGAGGVRDGGVQTPKPSAAEAGRFLVQATFGPNQTDRAAVMSQGYAAWLDAQLAMPPSGYALAHFEARQTAFDAYNEGKTTGLRSLGTSQFYEYFYGRAVMAPDSLRQRVAFALSQIFVVSMQDSGISGRIRSAAAYYDMLQADCFGTYRKLLEDVTLQPAMGIYLSSLQNTKENPATGRLPDENYAREIMQLMSIGLYQLEADGRIRTDAHGQPLPAYTYEDIAGLAKAFTGWSWYAIAPTDTTYRNGSGNLSHMSPMSFYPKYHSTAEKRFLGVTIPASTSADPAGDLKTALDTIAAHPNVGPFIATRLIQQLVTSNPSRAYVGRVAAAFNDNGKGQRGDLKAVIKAVLLDSEARDAAQAQRAEAGKLREPVLRFTAWLRAFNASSSSSVWQLGGLDAAASQLGQSPLNAPSVFNFWRPGYVPPGTGLAAADLVGPEFQLVNEVSVAGYVNFMQNVVANGLGGGASAVPPTNGSDITPDYASELALATDPAALAQRMDDKLLNGAMSSTLRQQIISAVTGVTLPDAAGDARTRAERNRVHLAVFMTVVSPEFLVQR